VEGRVKDVINRFSFKNKNREDNRPQSTLIDESFKARFIV